MAYSESVEKSANESMPLDEFGSRLSPTGDLVFSIVQLFFCCFSVLGNGCIFILFSSRTCKLNPVEILLLNLGIVDMLLSVASYPMSTISGFYHRWIFGLSGCYLYAFTCYFLGLAGIFTIAAIAVLRYITTCKIASSTLTITRRTSWQVMFACYATAFLWALLPLAQIGGYTFEPFGLSCTLDWLAVSTGSQLYISFVSFFCVAVPTLLILYSYVAILLNIRQKNALTENIGIQRKRCELQLTLATGLISGGFIFAWFPYTAVSIYTTFISKQVVLLMWATPIPVVMAKSSIVYNPLIYLFFPVSYRKEFCKIVTTRWEQALHKNREDVLNDDFKPAEEPNKLHFEAFGSRSSNKNRPGQQHIANDLVSR